MGHWWVMQLMVRAEWDKDSCLMAQGATFRLLLPIRFDSPTMFQLRVGSILLGPGKIRLKEARLSPERASTYLPGSLMAAFAGDSLTQTPVGYGLPAEVLRLPISGLTSHCL